MQRWTGTHFWPSSLQSLGLECQLNHRGGSCPSPSRGHRDFAVIDTNGVHGVTVLFCACHMAVPECEQLIRFGWYPASTTTPRTVASIACLTQFHILTLQSKVSAFDYYHTLSRLSDNASLMKSRVSPTLVAFFFFITNQSFHRIVTPPSFV